jgi:bacteriorhodopsin
MNLETCISIIAAYFYSIFVQKISDTKENDLPYTEITLTRYIDWMISTPFMLFVLCMVLGNEKNIPFTFKTFSIVLFLDLAMLLSGYLGETGKISKITGLVVGFLFFGLMYFYIWYTFMANGKNTFAVYLSYFIFLIVWSIYGIAYMMDEATKNIIYNILDLVAKAFVGIFFWMYFTKSVVF